VLKGLGPWITDISAKLAFVGPKKLQTLVLGGKQRVRFYYYLVQIFTISFIMTIIFSKLCCRLAKTEKPT